MASFAPPLLAAFAPPLFGSIGKNYKDLWKNKFDFKNQVKTVHKTSFGSLTTTGTLAPDRIDGSASVTYHDKSFGLVDGDIETGTGKAWVRTTLDKLHVGTRVLLSGGFDPTSSTPLVRDSLSGKAEVEHTQEYFTGAASVTVGEDKKDKNEPTIAGIIQASATIGFEGLSVGGQVQVDQNQQLSDYALGLQYQRDNFVSALLTENQAEVIKASWYHKVSPIYTTGVEVVVDEKKKVLNFASAYQLNAATLLKLRGSTTGDVAAAVEHRLSNPHVSVLVSSSWKLRGASNFKSDKVGVGLVFGDF